MLAAQVLQRHAYHARTPRARESRAAAAVAYTNVCQSHAGRQGAPRRVGAQDRRTRALECRYTRPAHQLRSGLHQRRAKQQGIRAAAPRPCWLTPSPEWRATVQAPGWQGPWGAHLTRLPRRTRTPELCLLSGERARSRTTRTPWPPSALAHPRSPPSSLLAARPRTTSHARHATVTSITTTTATAASRAAHTHAHKPGGR